MADDTVTVEMSEQEFALLEASVRWSKERCERKGLRRTQRKLNALQDTLDGANDVQG